MALNNTGFSSPNYIYVVSVNTQNCFLCLPVCLWRRYIVEYSLFQNGCDDWIHCLVCHCRCWVGGLVGWWLSDPALLWETVSGYSALPRGISRYCQSTAGRQGWDRVNLWETAQWTPAGLAGLPWPYCRSTNWCLIQSANSWIACVSANQSANQWSYCYWSRQEAISLSCPVYLHLYILYGLGFMNLLQ